MDTAERAFALDKQLKTMNSNSTEQIFLMGRILMEIKENKFWETLGHDTFVSYYSDPDLALARSTVYHAIKLVKAFEDPGEVLDVSYSKLILIAPYVSKRSREELVSMARTLSRSDLILELANMGLSQKKPVKPLPKVYRCRQCKGIIVDADPEDFCKGHPVEKE